MSEVSMAVPRPAPPSKDDVNGNWQYLQWGLDQSMLHPDERLDLKTYMSLYTSIHNTCMAQNTATQVGEDLYYRLNDYLKRYLQGLHAEMVQHSDEALIAYYNQQWKRFLTASSYNNRLYRFLNRHYVPRELDMGKQDVFEVYNLHMVRWKDYMLDSAYDAAMRLKLKQSSGETIEWPDFESEFEQVTDSRNALLTATTSSSSRKTLGG
ncbi:hypothetical protein LTR85_003321 [Meristemomyces frigidus]|nr:hypothetical protein LTR85_003321 [Meristemomyces frigidus]